MWRGGAAGWTCAPPCSTGYGVSHSRVALFQLTMRQTLSDKVDTWERFMLAESRVSTTLFEFCVLVHRKQPSKGRSALRLWLPAALRNPPVSRRTAIHTSLLLNGTPLSHCTAPPPSWYVRRQTQLCGFGSAPGHGFQHSPVSSKALNKQQQRTSLQSAGERRERSSLAAVNEQQGSVSLHIWRTHQSREFLLFEIVSCCIVSSANQACFL